MRQEKVKILVQQVLESQNRREFRDRLIKHLHFTKEQRNARKRLSGTTMLEKSLAVFSKIQHELPMFTRTT